VRIGGEFLTGCLLYRAWKAKLGGDRYWGWVGLAALVFAIPAAVLQPALAVPAFAITVYALAWDAPPLARVFGNRAAVYLGEISYSVYLVHWFVLQHANALGLSGLSDGSRVSLMFVLVIAASVATYHGVEKPSRSWLRQRLS
jgi:peptidoglycan/LPS O-acetylase OafA/YrhL